MNASELWYIVLEGNPVPEDTGAVCYRHPATVLLPLHALVA
ncbi:MAG: hypothetical protein K0Q66_2330 [Chitinophagaceae bacterium]|nr:hypothetical protein [Chitinophagaceae bacterium]